MHSMSFQAGRRNLICVLDWGIGHASRSLALARQLTDQGELVDFASAGKALAMLKKENAPATRFHSLPAYAVHYHSRNMILNIGLQLPKILGAIRSERQAMGKILAQHTYDRIISDSRFGCYSSSIPSVMLTHQLHPIFGLPFLGRMYRAYLLRYFSAYWVPDFTGEQRLSGTLSRPDGYPAVRYIGPLSRLPDPGPEVAKKYDYCCLLSGPEPQRTYLETTLLESLKKVAGHHLIISGRPDAEEDGPTYNIGGTRVDRKAFTAAQETALLLRQSKKIICRSGYSSLMDLDQLGCQNIILVPTPGQTEQLYLARHWQSMGRAEWVEQAGIRGLLVSPSLPLQRKRNGTSY